ncbi:hypothetical protein F4679DRAFT_588861 [Xylaria curta]|nr:hypothetical protein F4679DRAFT_588861 [Xylaria curta]
MPSCTRCKKKRNDEQMRECCNGIFYCSHMCKHADYPNHYKVCSKSIEFKWPDRPLSEPALIKDIYDPFNRLKRGDYLQGRPDTDVYKILIDAHRLRMYDENPYYKFLCKDQVFSLSKDGIAGFRQFLCQAKAIPRMMPSWWNEKKEAECVELGRQTGWSSLSIVVSDDAVCKHYDSPKPYIIRKHLTDVARNYYNDVVRDGHYEIYMDVQLRLLSEAIYGSGTEDTITPSLRKELIIYPEEELAKVTKIGNLLRQARFLQRCTKLLERLSNKETIPAFDNFDIQTFIS